MAPHKMKRTFPKMKAKKTDNIPTRSANHETKYLLVGWRVDEYRYKEGSGNMAVEHWTCVPGEERASFGDLTEEEIKAAWKAAYKAIRKMRGLVT